MSETKALLPLVAIVGPTASGKSALGIKLAEQFGGEVVACDSTQLYRGFDIGTAKPSAAERRAIPHHLIDETGNAFRYSPLGRDCICVRCLKALQTSRSARKNCASGSARALKSIRPAISIAC
jgi:cytidylate kinase